MNGIFKNIADVRKIARIDLEDALINIYKKNMARPLLDIVYAHSHEIYDMFKNLPAGLAFNIISGGFIFTYYTIEKENTIWIANGDHYPICPIDNSRTYDIARKMFTTYLKATVFKDSYTNYKKYQGGNFTLTKDNVIEIDA